MAELDKGATQRETAAGWYRQFHVSDYITLLHLPFAAVIIAYAVIGAAMAPYINVDRLVAAATAVFFAHQGSHYLDEIKGHPWGTRITDRMLYVVGFLFLATAIAIGVYLSLTVSLLLLAFMATLIFFPLFYSLEIWNKRFHLPMSFGITAALVCLGSFFLQSLTISLSSLLMSAAIGIQGTYICILYEGTKIEKTRDLAWATLKGIILIWLVVALAMVAFKLAW